MEMNVSACAIEVIHSLDLVNLFSGEKSSKWSPYDLINS